MNSRVLVVDFTISIGVKIHHSRLFNLTSLRECEA